MRIGEHSFPYWAEKKVYFEKSSFLTFWKRLVKSVSDPSNWYFIKKEEKEVFLFP